MSRTVRRQLTEILNTLKEANKLLESLFGGGREAEIVNLLAGCQNCAITMGNKIEAVYGTGTASVHGLEEYCEIIFQLSQNIHNKPECLQIYEKMKEQLLLVEENMNKEIPDKREVVFMPYKASMWDALESVYLAAKEDESCVAYVVPIPYFDRQADGSLGAMHYEGNEYPKNIEVTDWQSYNLEERMPDVVYIHNPYDEYNRVTSVHPKFYSGNLKKYTEELVYIPYFVLPEIEPDDEAAIESVKHFLFLPGIVNADRVIVQSEKMKQIYINEYLKGAKASGFTGAHLDREKLEEKFLGLGSPKFDKVLNTRKEDLEIPEEWLRIIQKPDSTWKKIIFYNTSVTALLQYDVKMLEKMKYVFRVFKEQQEEVALLWRPHPLIPSTIKSMRPHLWKEYEKIVEEYRQEGWGIYDDTADMDRAVVLSDAYYGDQSSVIELAHKCNKTVVIQEVEWKYSRKMFFYDCIWDEDVIYYPAVNFDALCRTNLTSGVTEIIEMFPVKEQQNVLLYAGIYKTGRFLILGPVRTRRSLLLIYDLQSGKFIEIVVEKDKKTWFNFREEQVMEVGNFLYIFPYVSVIIKINLINYMIEYLGYPQLGLAEEKHGQLVKIGQSIYIPLCNRPKIYKFDLLTEKFFVFEVSCDIRGIDTLCYDGEKFWLSGIEKGIYSWNEQTNECRKYLDFPTGFDKFINLASETGKWFSHSIYFEDAIYFIPFYANMIVKFELRQCKMHEIFIPNEEEQFEELNRKGRFSWGKYAVAKYRNGKILLLSNKSKVVYILDLKNSALEKINLTLKNYEQKIDWKEKLTEIQCQNGIFDLVKYIIGETSQE